MLGVSYSIRINVNKRQVFQYFSCKDKASLSVFVIPGLQVLLGVSAYIIK